MSSAQNNRRVSSSVYGVAWTALLSLLLPFAVWADDDEGEIEEIVVTGSLIKRDNFDSASPLQVLQMLELPYRKVLLCSGDIGFSARCRASKKGNPKKRPAGLGPAHPPARCPANGPRGPQTSEGEGAKYCPRSGAHVL